MNLIENVLRCETAFAGCEIFITAIVKESHGPTLTESPSRHTVSGTLSLVA